MTGRGFGAAGLLKIFIELNFSVAAAHAIKMTDLIPNWRCGNGPL
jgi:hypothetical protein